MAYIAAQQDFHDVPSSLAHGTAHRTSRRAAEGSHTCTTPKARPWRGGGGRGGAGARQDLGVRGDFLQQQLVRLVPPGALHCQGRWQMRCHCHRHGHCCASSRLRTSWILCVVLAVPSAVRGATAKGHRGENTSAALGEGGCWECGAEWAIAISNSTTICYL